MKMEQSVPKRRHIKFKRQGITQKKTYNTLHTTSEHGVSSITTADAHSSAASSRLNWCSLPI